MIVKYKNERVGSFYGVPEDGFVEMLCVTAIQELESPTKEGEEPVFKPVTYDPKLMTLIPEYEADAKYIRNHAIDNLKVTLKLGDGRGDVTLDANERSQERMNRMITTLKQSRSKAFWIDASGKKVELEKSEFIDALEMCKDAQSALWFDCATARASIAQNLKQGE